jgi:hypothetical protein
MKDNIKKLTLLMIITVIATFILAATVMADPPRYLRGQYVGTGGGSSFVAFCGFTSSTNLVPNYVSLGVTYLLQTYSQKTVTTYNPDGTGSQTGTKHVITFNPSPSFEYPWAGEQSFSSRFTYVIGPDGTITITTVPNTYTFTWTSGPDVGYTNTVYQITTVGYVSKDGKTIISDTGEPPVATFGTPISPCGPFQLFGTFSGVSIKQDEDD